MFVRQLVEACDLVDPATVAALAVGLAETAPRQQPNRFLTDRHDSTECRHEFGDHESVPITCSVPTAWRASPGTGPSTRTYSG
jgi:hypothetical protein